MSYTSILNQFSKIKVGTSDEYPVTRIRTAHKIEGIDDSNEASYEEITWDLDCGAEISQPTHITQLNENLRSQLAKRGDAVILTELGAARTLPASGADGSMIGYPRVEITGVPEGSFGQYQMFTMKATTRIPIKDAEGIWEHTQSTETTTGIDGNVTTNVAGSLRMDQGHAASTYVQNNIIDPIRSAANTAGYGVVSKIKVGNDPAQVEYNYTISPSATGQAGVADASVEDRTAKDETGRWIRTISGYSTGANATSFATSQRVSESNNLKLLRDEVSNPAIPDGRVSFNYQYVSGVAHAAFPGLFITRLEESIDQSGGGREILASAYLQNDPALRLGVKQPIICSESISIEFIGSFENIDPSQLLDADNQHGNPRISKSSSGILNKWRRSITYIYDTAPDPLPDPRTLDGIS